MSAKRKQPEIKLNTFTPPQRGPAAGAILGMSLGIQKEQEHNVEVVERTEVADKKQSVELPPTPVKEVDKEEKKSDSVETLLVNLRTDSFVSRHQKESFYIENDLHETFFDVTSGTKSAKTKLINLALKEFFENHNIEIKKFTGQYATGTRRKKRKVMIPSDL